MFFKIPILVFFLTFNIVQAGRSYSNNYYIPNNQNVQHTSRSEPAGANQGPKITIHLSFGPVSRNVQQIHPAPIAKSYSIEKAIPVPVSIGRSGQSTNTGNRRFSQIRPYAYNHPTRKVLPTTTTPPPPPVGFAAPVKPGKTDEINPRTIAGTFG